MVEANVEALVDEYKTVLGDNREPDTVVTILARECEWTVGAAQHLLELVEQNGWFVLRNALALALTLDKEDGELGF